MPGLRVLLALPLGTLLAQDPELAPATDPILVAIGETKDRFTVPVAVGAAGPFDFIIDTGAERTVVSHELATTLGLAPSGWVGLTSMTERSLVRTVVVPELAIAAIGRRHTLRAPALAARNIGAAGLLGIDALADHVVSIDFAARQMTVSPATRRRKISRDPDQVVIAARSKFGQLIVTDAYLGRTRVQVVIDTGAEMSIGNAALRHRLAGRDKTLNTIQLTSVTGGTTIADITQVPMIRVGAVQFHWLPIAFSDAAPFRYFELQKRPALLLGMNALRRFRRVDIDFANREIRFRMRKDVPGA